MYILDPNDITEEGIAVHSIENGHYKHSAIMRIVVKMEEDTELNQKLMEDAYRIVLALNLGNKKLEELELSR